MSMLGSYASYGGRYFEETEFLPPGSLRIGMFDRNRLPLPEGILHVGMYDYAEKGCYSRLCGTNVVGIEANPETFIQLTKPIGDSCGYRSYNFLAHDKDDVEVDFYLDVDRSSIYAHSEFNSKHSVDSSIKLKTKTLDTFIDEENIDMTTIDFLNIDVEGGELKVLDGIKKNLKHISVIFLETSYNDRFNSKSGVRDTFKYMRRRGFYPVEMSESFDDLGWGDVLFARYGLLSGV